MTPESSCTGYDSLEALEDIVHPEQASVSSMLPIGSAYEMLWLAEEWTWLDREPSQPVSPTPRELVS